MSTSIAKQSGCKLADSLTSLTHGFRESPVSQKNADRRESGLLAYMYVSVTPGNGTVLPNFWLQVAGPKEASDLVPQIVFLVRSGCHNLDSGPRPTANRSITFIYRYLNAHLLSYKLV